MAWCGEVRQGKVWFGFKNFYGLAWCGEAWLGMVWFGFKGFRGVVG